MRERRVFLKGLGAGLGLTGLSVLSGLYRIGIKTQDLGYALGDPGPDVKATLPRIEGQTATLGQTEGPYYFPKSPLRRDVRASGRGGADLVLRGRVLDPSGRPVAGAVIDMWQADENGNYDLHGYGYRGHQFTDVDGRYELMTVRPKAYRALGIFRAPHIHFKLQGPETRMLTTQLYFPDEITANGQDRLFDESLQVNLMGRDGSAQLARFDLVLEEA